MTYPGGKAGAGVYQRIINQIPLHRTYIEPFAGGAAIYRKIRPAQLSILIDRDLKPLSDPTLTDREDRSRTLRIVGDAVALLASGALSPAGTPDVAMSDRCFVYADPPYLWETRRSQRDVYRHEFGTLEEHERLLDVLETLACPVMLSGYRSELYDRRLASWRRIDFQAMTRGGAAATESIWMNYPEPEILHDYRYLGEDFRQRERITRKARRWQNGLRRMPRAERQAVLSALIEDTVASASPDVAILEDRIGS